MNTLIMQILKALIPTFVNMFGKMLGGGTSAAVHIERAGEKAANPIEWIEEVKKQVGEGEGHPLDRIMKSAIESEETKAKWKRGFGGALDIGLGIAKKVILP